MGACALTWGRAPIRATIDLVGFSMKVTINVDCTPEEARTFLGLPDVQPLQEEMMKALRDRMMAAVGDMDPDKLLKGWMAAGTEGMEQMMKFWADLSKGGKP